MEDDNDSETLFRDVTSRVNGRHVAFFITAANCVLVLMVTIAIIHSDPATTIPCPAGTTKIMERCFLFLSEKENVSWSEAREECKSRNSDLAIIDDCDLMHRLIYYIHANEKEPTAGYWIGGTDEKLEGNWFWVDGTPVSTGSPFWGTSYTGNVKFEPAGNITQNCLQLWARDAHTFHDGACFDVKQFACEVPQRDGQCPSGYDEIRGQCFQIVNLYMSWDKAITYCSMTRGGHLAHLKNCKVFGDFVNYLRTKEVHIRHRPLWIGGNDRGQDNIWVWTDGSQIELGAPFWGKNEDGALEPTGTNLQNCLAMVKRDRYYFHDQVCDENGHAPLCEAKPFT